MCGVVGLLVMSIVGVSQYFRYGDATRSLRGESVSAREARLATSRTRVAAGTGNEADQSGLWCSCWQLVR